MAGSKIRVKRQIDLEVARDLGIPLRKVTSVTTTFIELLNKSIAENGEVMVDGLGSFKVSLESGTRGVLTPGVDHKRRVQVPVKIRVYFSKSPTLKKVLNWAYKEKEHGKQQRNRRHEQVRGR